MPEVPDDAARRARWSILALLFVCRASLGLQFQTLGSTADPLVAQFGFSYAEIGTLIGLFMLPGLLALGRLVAGRIADRSGRHATVRGVCMAVAVAWLLPKFTAWAVVWSLTFGLMGAAPAGIIMALSAQAMAPQRRAFGMGVFFSFYFVPMTAAPPVAGWLFDRTGSAYAAIVFAAGLFAAAGLCLAAFGPLKRRLAVG